MKKWIAFLFIAALVSSCQSEQPPETTGSATVREAATPLAAPSLVTKVDTLFSPNAPRRITRNIKRDRAGRLLMAAYDDVIFYDGFFFTQLDKQGRESWYAFDALEDSRGDIWIASDQSGAFRVDGRTGEVTQFTPEDGLGHRRNMCVYEDRAGNIWVGGQGGLSRYEDGRFRTFTVADGLPHNDISTILEDRAGNLWLGTRGNAGRYDGTTFHELKNEEGKPFVNVWSILEDRSGTIWLVDESGLWKYQDGEFTRELTDVWKLHEDTGGSLWATSLRPGGTSSLKRLTEQPDTIVPAAVVEVFRDKSMFFGLGEDRSGRLWIGGGNGVWSYDGTTVQLHTGVPR